MDGVSALFKLFNLDVDITGVKHDIAAHDLRIGNLEGAHAAIEAKPEGLQP
ncbi:MAG TPA: hypothetical protein VMF53_06660 [Alphaproteobacteria bacterium]|nr:hypothetical protein [Alphaproteobacteria bacterium]